MSQDPDEAVVAVLHAAATLWVDKNRRALDARAFNPYAISDEPVLAFTLLAERGLTQALKDAGLR